MFFFKKLISRFVFPVPLCAELLVLGLVLWSFTRWKKLGRGLVIGGTALLLVFSYPWLPRLALSRLESRYATVTGEGESKNGPSDYGLRDYETTNQGAVVSGQWSVVSSQWSVVSGQWSVVSSQRSVVSSQWPPYIMVLGDTFSADSRRSAAARFGDEGLKRLLEGVRLHRGLTNSSLLVSIPGPTVSEEEKERVLGELLFTFGLETNSVQVCVGARDTEDEIAWCRRAVGTNRVLVVSSASHLPRAMVLAQKHGLQAIPAPSGYLVDTVTRSPFSPDRLFPGSFNLYQCERAANEYLGLAWERLRGGAPAKEGRRR